MKVKELKEILAKLDDDVEVFSEDSSWGNIKVLNYTLKETFSYKPPLSLEFPQFIEKAIILITDDI